MYVNRKLEGEISKFLNRKEIIAVIGPRQAGKTTMINKLLDDLENVNKVSFDDIESLHLFENNIYAFIELNVKGFDYLFIDEIQYSMNSGKILKYIYDTQKIKIFISGSSASEISIKSLKYLVGRVFIYQLYPFSFEEFLTFKDEKIKNILLSGKSIGLERKINGLLNEFLTFGGYPEVVLADSIEEKILILKNIYNTYFLREIKEIFGISDDFRLTNLLKALSLQIGNIINYTELSSITNFSEYEVKKYLNILEKTYICFRSLNFHTNKRTELKKSPKIFFFDTGFRNIAINNFKADRIDMGSIRENFVANELVKNGIEFRYWRTTSKSEVDFVIENNNELIPIEVKSSLSKNTIGKALFSFIEKYKPKKVFILSLEFYGERMINKTKVKFLPIMSINSILSQLSL